MKTLLLIILIGFFLYAIIIAGLMLMQESLLFYPAPLPSGHSLAQTGVTEKKIPVPGGELSAVHFRQAGAKGLIFFLHGNAGNIETWLPDTEFYRRNNYDLFMIDYRGFGKSTGHIQSEKQLHADVLAAWRSIADEYAGRPIVVYGRSLGSGLAVKLAIEASPTQVILVSPYSSFVQLGREHFPWAPSFATRYTLRTDQWIKQVKSPILMIHGDADKLIAVSHAEALKTLRPDADLQIIKDAGHLDISSVPQYTQIIEGKLAALATKQ